VSANHTSARQRAEGRAAGSAGSAGAACVT